MQLHSILFASKSPERYERMASVLLKSARENSPASPMMLHRIYSADNDVQKAARAGAKVNWVDNARKAKHHAAIINDADDGALIGMLDADMMVLDDISELERIEFDIAYTVRPPGSRWRMNSGAYFLRATAAVKAFFTRLAEVALKMLGSASLHAKWRDDHRFGGTHQAAFGLVLAENPNLKTVELPCTTWNCVHGCWDKAENPKIVHIVSSMRQWCFGVGKPKTQLEQRIVDQWREYAAEI